MRKRVTLTASIRQAATSPFGGVAAARDARVMLTYDASLAWTTLLLLAFGLVMVYSASIAMSEASRTPATARGISSCGTASSSSWAWSPQPSRSRCR